MGCEEEGLPPPELPADRGKWFVAMGGHSSQQSYPSPPHIVGEITGAGGETRRRSPANVDEVVGRGINEFGSSSLGGNLENSVGMRAHIQAIPRPKFREGKGKERELDRKGWIVPEKNRVHLMVVDFHIPDRYIKVKCQRAIMGPDGRREERETVIAW